MFFHFFDMCYPKIFMLFVDTVKGDVSLIALSPFLLYVYMRATDFLKSNLVSFYHIIEGFYQL